MVHVIGKDNQFEPATDTTPAGKPVKVTFVNEGENLHEVKGKGLMPEMKLQPGQSRKFTVTPEKKTYELSGEIPVEQGMKGTFTGQ